MHVAHIYFILSGSMNNVFHAHSQSSSYSFVRRDPLLSVNQEKVLQDSSTGINSTSVLILTQGNIFIHRTLKYFHLISSTNLKSVKMDDKEEKMEASFTENTDNKTHTPKPINEAPETPRKAEVFRPANFPLSPAFTPPLRAFNPLPGIVPERPTSYENIEEETLEETENEIYDETSVGIETDGLTLSHFLFAILAVIFSIMFAIFIMLPGKKVLSITKNTFLIENHVNNLVIGQTAAVTSVLSALRKMTEEPEASCRVLLLTGGPGVGKDYLTHVIQDHIYSSAGQECKDNSHLRLSPKYFDQNQCCVRRDFTLYSFESVYSMDPSQIEQSTETLKAFMKYCNQIKKKIAVLVPVLAIKAHSIPSIGLKGVDSIKSYSEYWNIIQSQGEKFKKALSAAGVKSELVLFNPMSPVDVTLCILKSAQLQGRAPPSLQTMEEILTSLLGSTRADAGFVPVGCKDVDSFVALMPSQE